MVKTPQQTLKQYWGYEQFRPPQLEIINAVLQQKDTLALLPTGGGKSLCFQLPGLMMEGVCLVVTPLVALMHDQVEQLKKRGIAAVAIHSGMRRREIDVALDNCVYGKIRFLYLSPERIQTELFIERAKKMPITLIAVDEAHCISEWGYDFRPPYLKIADLREIKPDATWIALTATATEVVKQDILSRLGLQNPAIFKKSFARENLSFVVRSTENREKQLLDILQKVNGSAIVYTRSRKSTEQLAQWLKSKEVSASFYHAGLTHEDRSARQKAWTTGKTRVIVATNAFGMGIDKADVRIVIHVDVPETLEAYYQEAGRAGRDGLKAYAVIIYHQQDLTALNDKIDRSHPPPATLKKTYQALANYYGLAVGSAQGQTFDLDIYDFCARYKEKPSSVYPRLKRLEEQNLILLNEGFHRPSRIHFQGDKKSLYAAQVANKYHDQIIKTMLRSYGGELFSGFTAISESQIARLLKWSLPETKKNLKHLQKLQLIHYEPASGSPQITFILARQAVEKLPLDKAKLESRRKQAMRRLEAVVAYTQQRHQCRMQTLQSYFGEETFNTCGRCDICLEKKKTSPHPPAEDYRERIRMLLEQQPMTVGELEKKIGPTRPGVFTGTLKEMLEATEIRYDEYWVLRKS